MIACAFAVSIPCRAASETDTKVTGPSPGTSQTHFTLAPADAGHARKSVTAVAAPTALIRQTFNRKFGEVCTVVQD